jgi:hypothetical protein
VEKRVNLLVYFMSIVLTLTSCGQEAKKECKGRFRWDVKTMTDSKGIKLFSEVPFDSTISQLILVRPPAKMFILSKKDGRLPRFKSEEYLVKIVALVTKMDIRKDQDYHIVLKSPDSKASLIGEIPDPDCSYIAGFPVHCEKFRLARSQGDVIYKILKETKKPVLVEVIGVPFWDAPHFWIKGSSRTGREIHPILEIRVLEK